jgi:short-subunit dehydrogenase involved in D-alanine esterification of teichoic acids
VPEDIDMPAPVVLVTGALTGIGRATAVAFARDGARLIISGRRDEAGQSLAAELHALGTEAEFVHADVRHEAQVRALVDRAVERFGGLDVAVNNAGTEGKPGLITEQSPESYAATFDTNVLGVILSLKHEMRVMLPQGRGSIINLSSTLGSRGVAGASMYVASKHAVEGLAATPASIRVPIALISGLTPTRRLEKMAIGRVVVSGPARKLDVTTSSNDSVIASSQPDKIAGIASGRVIVTNTRKGRAPRSRAAFSNERSRPRTRAKTTDATMGAPRVACAITSVIMPLPCSHPVIACNAANNIRNENPNRISGAKIGIASSASSMARPGNRSSRPSAIPARVPMTTEIGEDNRASLSDR